MEFKKDIWRAGIVAAPLPAIVARGSVAGLPVTWLPEVGPLRYLADPFGLWRGGRLHVFAELYDYRTRRGTIEALVFDAQLQLLERRCALAMPWHLSYPFVFEDQGATWMLPEAHRSGGLTLYRAVEFPFRWEAAHRIALDQVPLDATPFFHAGRWWLFYTSTARRMDRNAALHVSWATQLPGPWHAVRGNPVRFDPAGARPGGTPLCIDGRVMLPVQDCSQSYGGALRPLWFDALTPEEVALSAGPVLTSAAAFAPYTAGLHTLAAAGPVTLIDVKRTRFSLPGLLLDARRKLRRKLRRADAAPASAGSR